MTQKELQQITNFPEHVIPTKNRMVEYYLHFKCDTGAIGGVTQTNCIDDIIQLYNMAKEYYQTLQGGGKAKAMFLDVRGVEERFEG